MDTAEIGKRTRQENRRLTWLAVKQNKASYLMIAPFMLFFLVFTIVPVVMSLPMGFTDFNMVQMPKFVGLSNYTTLFLSDKVFIQSIRVTLVFALFTGPISYVLCFLLAWLINELHPKLRTIFTLIFYAPSMANVYTVWKLIFSGDSYGYLNSFLLDLGIISSPIQWLTDGSYVLGVTIVVQMWISLGAGKCSSGSPVPFPLSALPLSYRPATYSVPKPQYLPFRRRMPRRSYRGRRLLFRGCRQGTPYRSGTAPEHICRCVPALPLPHSTAYRRPAESGKNPFPGAG